MVQLRELNFCSISFHHAGILVTAPCMNFIDDKLSISLPIFCSFQKLNVQFFEPRKGIRLGKCFNCKINHQFPSYSY